MRVAILEQDQTELLAYDSTYAPQVGDSIEFGDGSVYEVASTKHVVEGENTVKVYVDPVPAKGYVSVSDEAVVG